MTATRSLVGDPRASSDAVVAGDAPPPTVPAGLAATVTAPEPSQPQLLTGTARAASVGPASTLHAFAPPSSDGGPGRASAAGGSLQASTREPSLARQPLSSLDGHSGCLSALPWLDGHTGCPSASRAAHRV
eukprot:6367750-Prymnesium_polylepis.1